MKTLMHYSVPGAQAHQGRTGVLDDARHMADIVATQTGGLAVVLAHYAVVTKSRRGQRREELVELYTVVLPPTDPAAKSVLTASMFELGWRRCQDASGHSYDPYTVRANMATYTADPAAFIRDNAAWYADISWYATSPTWAMGRG